MTRKLSRRDFLKTGSLVAAGAALGACSPQVVKETVAPEVVVVTATPPPPQDVELTIMYPLNEWTEDHNKALLAETPLIKKINMVQDDQTRLVAMFAAGSGPDAFQLNGTMLPNYILSRLVQSISPLVMASDVVKKDDLAPCHGMLTYEPKSMTVNTGELYGIAKDWSPDYSLWINTAVFEDAGLETPADDKVYSFNDLLEVGRKILKKQGDRTIRWGFSTEMLSWCWTQGLMECMDQVGAKIYPDDMNTINLANNPAAVDWMRYMYTLLEENIAAGPLDPSSSWDGDDFSKGKYGVVQFGFWYGPMAEGDEYKGKVKMLRAPTWGSNTSSRNPCAAATCTVMGAQTKFPEVTWKAIEFFSGKLPAEERAKSGWGVPALKSLYPMIPNSSDFEKQKYNVLMKEVETVTFFPKYNPYYNSQNVGSDAWAAQTTAALKGEITFDEMVANIETTHNDAIAQGISKMP
jgi:multiple sugar transport system substrate-binding protein